ncbi:MAG: hypothetical protein DHS20C12_12340 [Pseudohongiella sp.]|nr:MAG: hypothetical protein DHS20C12_12340 [Pseudohongiella sp.]
MNELKRQAYLEAMDIQTYFPRQQLPGAKPSPIYEIPKIVAEAEDSIAHAPAQADKKQTSLKAIEELRSQPATARKATVTAIKPAEQAPNEQEVDAAAEQAQSLNFTLRYHRISETLAVLDEVPTQGSRQLNEQSRQLMQGILTALGQNDFDSLSSAEEFSWPPLSEYSRKNTPEIEAAKAIAGFLQMRHETDGFSNLLVFAAQVEEVLLRSDTAARDFDSGKGYFTTITHSLPSMLAVPTLKRDVWQHLQVLKKRIDSVS